MQRQVDRYKGERSAKRDLEPALAGPSPMSKRKHPKNSLCRAGKTIQMVPMDETEAIEQMELLGHDFFVFFNANLNQVNVLYRRRNGEYGLTQPEPA